MDYNLAKIKSISESSVVLEFRGKQYEVEITDEDRQPLYDGMEEGIFLVPFDPSNKKILMTVDTKEVYDTFPEVKMLDSELKDSVKSYEEEDEE